MRACVYNYVYLRAYNVCVCVSVRVFLFLLLLLLLLFTRLINNLKKRFNARSQQAYSPLNVQQQQQQQQQIFL